VAIVKIEYFLIFCIIGKIYICKITRIAKDVVYKENLIVLEREKILKWPDISDHFNFYFPV